MAYGGVDSYDFHAYETAQCMSRASQGGEVGISQRPALEGDAAVDGAGSERAKITRELIVAALCRSHNLPVEAGYPTDAVTYEWAKAALPKRSASSSSIATASARRRF